MDPISVRIRQLRKARKMTQRKLAALANIQVNYLCMIENGSRHGSKMAVDTAMRLAQALGVTTDYLLGLQDTCHG